MSEQIVMPASEVSFKDFLFKNRRNTTILWLAAASIIIEFGIFKYFYPYASFIHGDSFSYLNAADKNLSINTYLIGYSKFLRVFNAFFKSDLALTAFQYLFIQASAIFLIFTIFYFYKSNKVTQNILMAFMIFNPLFLHLGNLVSSDGLFLALSMTWFALLLWIVHRPSFTIFIWHAVVLFVSFTFRYNALIYPLIALIAFGLAKISIRRKVLGLSVSVIPILFFVINTSYQYKRLTGYWQYAPFSGWQLANNAMYTFRYVDSAERKPVPEKFKALDNMIREYFDSSRNVLNHPIELFEASTVYMWTPRLSLMKYKDTSFKNKKGTTELKKWASMGPLYKEYGIHIIKQYPLLFVQHFLWPNAQKYYAPPIEFLESYNTGKSNVTSQAQVWFNYKSRKISTRMKDNRVVVLSFYPIMSGIINVVMLCSLICYIMLKGWRYNITFKRGILLGSSLWLINALFTISASSAALRFQSFPIILTTVCAVLLIDWMVQLIASFKNNEVGENKIGIESSYQQSITI